MPAMHLPVMKSRGLAVFRLRFVITALALMTTFSGSRAARSLPEIEINPVVDFYFTLRATPLEDAGATSNDASSLLPPRVRRAAEKLRGLTEFLPDSLALKSQQESVLIIYRKNPRHTAYFERLLWRRSDPLFAGIRSVEEVPAGADRIAMKLLPVCGAGADSIGAGIKRLYKEEYPAFLEEVWPARRTRLGGFAELMERDFRPAEEEALRFLSESLGIDFPSRSSIRVVVVSDGVGGDGRLFAVGGDSWIWLTALPDKQGDLPAMASFLGSFCRVSDQMDERTSAFSLLEAALQKTPDGSLVARPVTDALLDHVTGRMIADHLDLPDAARERASGAQDAAINEEGDLAAEFLPIVAKHWDSFLAGDHSMEVACQKIAADVSGWGAAGLKGHD